MISISLCLAMVDAGLNIASLVVPTDVLFLHPSHYKDLLNKQ